jgi:hypothetical protein
MVKRLGGNFTFIATEKIEEERIQLGYEDLNHKYPFVLNVYESDEKEQRALCLIRSVFRHLLHTAAGHQPHTESFPPFHLPGRKVPVITDEGYIQKIKIIKFHKKNPFKGETKSI